MVACCNCGGGASVTQPQSQLTLVDSAQICQTVWPSRAVYDNPPWEQSAMDYCRLLSGICMRKLQAMTESESGQAITDDPRIYGICEQKTFAVTRLPFLEDSSPAQEGASLKRGVGFWSPIGD